MKSLFHLTYSKNKKTSKTKEEAAETAAAATQKSLDTITSEDDGDLVLISNFENKVQKQPAEKKSPEAASDTTTSSGTFRNVWSALENFVAEAEEDKNKAFLG
jgi:hypothetical protein